MIRLEENLGGRVEAKDGNGRVLEWLLDGPWQNYRKAHKACRKELSEPSVHALRVAIRRMLSALALAEAVVSRDLIADLEGELKDRLKALSRLRDTQVQIETLGEMLHDAPELKPFLDWLRAKERRLIKRLERKFVKARRSKTARRLRRLIGALQEANRRTNRTIQLRERLVKATGEAFEKVIARYRSAGPQDLAKVHRIRIAFKQFRYMVEALAGMVPGITNRQLRAMQACQKSMGNIQDVEVLLARLDKFGSSVDLKEKCWQAFRQRLLRRRAHLVKRFFASVDRLMAFWPIERHEPPVASKSAPYIRQSLELPLPLTSIFPREPERAWTN